MQEDYRVKTQGPQKLLMEKLCFFQSVQYTITQNEDLLILSDPRVAGSPLPCTHVRRACRKYFEEN